MKNKSEDNNAMCEENMQTIGNQCEALKKSSWAPGDPGLCCRAMDCLPLHICPPLPQTIEFINLDIDTFILTSSLNIFLIIQIIDRYLDKLRQLL